ncbi:thiol peroxidase, partial [mine drainage metagenome]
MTTITLRGQPIHTGGNLPKIHALAPDFQLVNSDLELRSLKDFRGRKKLFNIFPSIDTPVCALSTKKFNDHARQHPEPVFLMVSADLPFAQKRFCGIEGLANVVTLSMMRDRDFARDWGLLVIDGPLAGLAARA